MDFLGPIHPTRQERRTQRRDPFPAQMVTGSWPRKWSNCDQIFPNLPKLCLPSLQVSPMCHLHFNYLGDFLNLEQMLNRKDTNFGIQSQN